MKLAGAVTFYHCDVGQFIKNINSYLNELDILYVLDNNEQIILQCINHINLNERNIIALFK